MVSVDANDDEVEVKTKQARKKKRRAHLRN
jgi:hypothetical protein